MAAGKPDIMILLLNKLMEDGNILYKVGLELLQGNLITPHVCVYIKKSFKVAKAKIFPADRKISESSVSD